MTARDPFQYKSDYFQRSYRGFIWLARSSQEGFEGSRLSPSCQENKSFFLRKTCSLTASAFPSLDSLPPQTQSTWLDCQMVHVHRTRPHLLCQCTSALTLLTCKSSSAWTPDSEDIAGFWRGFTTLQNPPEENTAQKYMAQSLI